MAASTITGSTLTTGGKRIACDDTKPVFVQGAYNLGAIIEQKELVTVAVHPGEGLDWGTGAGGEDSVTIMADGSTTPAGVAEVDFGLIADCSVDYTLLQDDIPCIFFHWNLGALLRNIVCVDTTAAVGLGSLITTNSGTAGSFDDTAGGGAYVLRSYLYNASSTAFDIVAWIMGVHVI